jgi:DNA-binding NarL/FixJ family response regulator
MIELALDVPNMKPARTERRSQAQAVAAGDRIRMILIDPDAISRHAVSDALRRDGRFIVMAQAESSVEGVELALHYRPALVVIATAVPGMDAVSATQRITSVAPEVRVVLLSAARELELETSAVRAGASGFLDKGAGIASIAHSLRLVAAGESVISREMTGHLVDRLRRTPEDGYGICSGATTRTIADDLFLSTETVNSHVKRILRKLGVHSRGDAIAAAGRLRSEILV